MRKERNDIDQREVAGFLLGLGIGLVVGLVVQQQSTTAPRGLSRENVKQAEPPRLVARTGSEPLGQTRIAR
jgi:hypothetical protein